jgi:pimeloyl-ACP methyl ester carboxylesterase
MPNTIALGTGYSAAAPSEQQAYRTRAGYKGDGTKTGIICCHSGGGAAATTPYPSTNLSTAFPRLQMWLADCGWPVVTPDLGGDPCCNDTGSARVEEARTWLQAAPQSAKAGKVILLGWSEGGGIAMKYALDHPGSVAAMVLLQPLSDLQDVVTNNRGGFASLLNAAYPGGYSDGVYGAAHNPKLFAPTLAASGIPAYVAYASDDPVVVPSSVQSVITGLGATVTPGLVSTGGHGEGFLSKLIAADGSCAAIANWLNALGL